MKPLTQRQAEILNLIQSFVENTGFPPTRSDIARALSFKSANAAEDHLKAIEKKGHIKLTRGTSRGIQLLKNSGLPIVGRVAAGQPILSEEHIQNRVQVEQSLFRPAADYLLKVRGSSMRDVGIHDGDFSPSMPHQKHGLGKSSWHVSTKRSRSNASNGKTRKYG